MGFNDFYKGFKNNNQTRIASKPILKKEFGPRMVEEFIKSRFQSRTDNTSNDITKTSASERSSVDYQRFSRANRNIRNLDKWYTYLFFHKIFTI